MLGDPPPGRPIGRTGWALAIVVGLLLLSPVGAMAATISVQLQPSTVNPRGSVVITAFCTSGTSATATSSAFPTVSMGRATSGGGFSALVTVPTTTATGTYNVHVSCSNGDSGDASLTVAPSGGAGTGDGTMAGGVDRGLVGAGLALIAAAFGVAFLLLRRRANG
jgi:hypothetical protein